jgi:acetylornithine/N-succinyldiaminopimelate aminotransferase
LDNPAFSRAHLWNVVNPLPIPGINVVGAKGSYLHLEDGRKLLDFWGDEGVASLGYNSPEVRRAMRNFLELDLPHRLPQVYGSAARSELAARLCIELGYDRAFFANSGTEANEAAIKLARLFQHKTGNENKMGVLTLPNNFHGTTGLAMASCDSTDSPRRKEGFGPMAAGFGVLRMEEGGDVDDFDIEWHDESWDYSEGDVGAVICAPILGNNCVKVYPPGYLQRVRDWCDERGALLLYDEVQSGMGRTGYRAAFQHPLVGVKPDIIALGKGIALGFPMTATLAMENVAKVMEPGCHYSSFAGGDFICHMALHLQGWLDSNICRVEAGHNKISAALSGMSWIKSVDGLGFMLAFTPDFERHGYDGFQFCAEASKHGLLLCTFRAKGAIRYNPPLNVSAEELDESFAALQATHAALAR